MKRLIALCLLAAGAAYAADPPKTAKTTTTDEAKTRAQLEEARARLDKAAREVAELSSALGAKEQRQVHIIRTGGDRRAILGVNVDPESGKEGARIRSVSPGGPAEEAGLQSGDVIISLDGESLTGGENGSRALVDKMRKVKPDQKVKVRVLRAGKNKDVLVVARPMVFEDRLLSFNGPEMGGTVVGGVPGVPGVRQFRYFWPGDFAGLELTSLTPKLGAYFGTSEGVLVVQTPENGSFKLEDGDVIQTIDGRKPEDGAHALRILRSYKSGEKLNLGVLRQKKPLTLAVTMPERPEFDGEWFGNTPPMPPVPATPALPPLPSTAPLPPMGPGTDE